MKRHGAAKVAGAALASATVAGVALRRGLLDAGGAAGAAATGTAITSAGGVDWAATLVYFFVTSSVLSRAFTRRKRAVEQGMFAKGGRRDFWQVAANGGIATALALVRATPWAARWSEVITAGFVAALASANADTWATEVGTLSPRPPRLVTTGRVVPAGTSGGVTALGLGATAAGALSLSAFFVVARRVARHSRRAVNPWSVVAAGTLGGIAGSLADSVLGAAWQAVYRCPRCDEETEQRTHRCGAVTEQLRGIAWLDNDGVNALSTAIGAVSGAASWSLLCRCWKLPCGD